MTIFEKLERISNDYRNAVDELGVKYEKESRFDVQYNDEVKAKRHQDRAAVYDTEIIKLADQAKAAAESEIAKLRAALQTYITTSADPTVLQTLQTLLAAGTTLTGAEISAFEAKGGYAVLRLLEETSKGLVHAPRVEGFETDLVELSGYFGRLSVYRAEMGDTNPGMPFGQSGGVGSTIMQCQIEKFPAKLAEMSTRWAVMGDI